jgi:hypothetical protein
MVREIASHVNNTYQKKRGRGRPPTGAESVHLRLLPNQLADVDKWAAGQSDKPTRPEAIRRLIEQALATAPKRGR